MASDSNSQPTHLEPSELGTKEYWDGLYTNELSNHASNPSDTGTVWFDDSDAEAKILTYLSNLSESQSGIFASQTTSSLLDLGCGNGSLLRSLREDGWTGRALGVDYSPQSIALANQIGTPGETDGATDDAAPTVEFLQWDILQDPLNAVLEQEQAYGWDIVLDKGTFDAISLSDELGADGKRLCESYRDKVLQLVKKGGTFLITSCNWTEPELRSWFEVDPNGTGFSYADKIVYPSFSFGGVKGQTVSTLCFVKGGT